MMKLLCIGDVALGVSKLSQQSWLPPLDVALGNESRVLLNWELPIGDSINPVARSKGSRLLSHPDSPCVLVKWSPGFATLATNHILDAGEVGLVNTIKSLNQIGFSTVGAGRKRDEIEKVLVWEENEGRVAIINWVFPETHPDWMLTPGPNCWRGPDEAIKTVEKVRGEVDWVMVVTHWSDELFPYPRPEDRVIARELADAGIDILVSHHPHVVRGMEEIGTCPIFYSLGNFYFSDFLDGSGEWVAKWAPRNHEGLGIQISFKHGLKPEYQMLSFWQMKDKVIIDPLHRAERRLKQTSRVLGRFRGNEYEKWYKSERRRFERVWARWYFGVQRWGVSGTVQFMLRKLRPIVK